MKKIKAEVVSGFLKLHTREVQSPPNVLTVKHKHLTLKLVH